MKLSDIFNFNKREVKAVTENGTAKAIVVKREKHYEDNSHWVALAINKIATVTVATEMNFFNLKGQEIEVISDDHKIAKMMRKPDGQLSFKKWIKKIVGIYVLSGKVHLYHDEIENNLIIIKGATKLPNGEYKIKINGKDRVVESKNIYEFINPDFTSTIYSTSNKIKNWIRSDYKLNQLFERVSANGSVTGGVVKTNLRRDTELEKFKTEWEENYEGFEKNTADIILPNGFDYDSQNTSPKDANLIELLNTSQKKILMAYGVPETLFGIVDGKGRANIDGAFYGFIKFTILPLMEELDELFNEIILPDLDENVFFDYVNPLPADNLTDAQVRQIETGGKGWKTPNEIREEIGLESKDGNDELNPNPMDAIFSTEQLKMPTPRKVPTRIIRKIHENKTQKVKKETPKMELRKIFQEVRKEKKRIVFNKKGEDWIDQRANETDKKLEKHEKTFYEKLKEKKVAETEKLAKEILDGKFKRNFEKRENETDFTKEIKLLINEEANETMARLQSKAEFVLDKKVMEKAIGHFILRENSWNETTQKAILKTVKDGMKAGHGRDKIAKTLKEVVKHRTEQGLKVIAFDTTRVLSGLAVQEAMEQSRVVTHKVWISAGDERTCNQCGALHGRVVGVKEDFVKKGASMVGLDGKAIKNDFETIKYKPAHSRCRCEIISKTEITEDFLK